MCEHGRVDSALFAEARLHPEFLHRDGLRVAALQRLQLLLKRQQHQQQQQTLLLCFYGMLFHYPLI